MICAGESDIVLDEHRRSIAERGPQPRHNGCTTVLERRTYKSRNRGIVHG